MINIIIGIILGVFIYYKIIKPTHFWADRDIPHVASWPLIGNMWDLLSRKKHFVDIVTNLYNKFPQHRYVGYIQFMTPTLMIRDLELIKQITVKEFDHFHDHMHIPDVEIDPLLSKILVNLTGDKWKAMRATLSPAFTSSKMRNMYNLIAECAKNFTKHFEEQGGASGDMKDLFTRFANNVIATTAFGIQIDTVKDPNNEFVIMSKKLTEIGVLQAIKFIVLQYSPKLLKILNIKLLRQEIADFFRTIITNNIDRRLKEGIIRPDMIHLMLEARKGRLQSDNTLEDKPEGFATVQESQIAKTRIEMELTDDHIIAQALLFFIAGFETVSLAISWMSYELALNPDIQKKLQQEIDEITQKYSEKVPYDALLSMKYLDQVICESLRLWPPAFQTDRFCTKEFVIKPKNPQERTVVIEKGMSTIIPIIAIHKDPQYFPDPERFDPERFNDENKANIKPGSYMPFGAGPRNCIGSRFALLEMKTLFFYLLSKFDIVPTEQTCIPPKISPKKVNFAPENGFQLSLKPRVVQK